MVGLVKTTNVFSSTLLEDSRMGLIDMDGVKSVPDRLHAAANLFEERNAAYGANYLQIGGVLHAMFPHGLEVRGTAEWTRVFCMIHRMTKETRYATNMARGGGHTDSMEDLSVYAIMTNETDEIASCGVAPIEAAEVALVVEAAVCRGPATPIGTSKNPDPVDGMCSDRGLLSKLKLEEGQLVRVGTRSAIARGGELSNAQIRWLLQEKPTSPPEEPEDNGPDEWRR